MKTILLATTCIASALLAVQPAFAQDQLALVQTGDGEAADTGQDPGESGPVAQEGIEEITITAQRRAESLQRAAIAVSVADSGDLINAGVTNPQALTSLVPALQVANAAGPYALFYLRGVGNFNGNSLSDSAVAVNLDGVFLSRPSSTSGLLFDVDRVEVLKGPQGTLYGRNATGGAINIVTRRPQLGEFGGEFMASYGNYDAIQLNGALNVPIGESMAVRVAGQYVEHDAYMTDGTGDQDDLAGRIHFRWEPSSTVTIQFGADYFRQRGAGIGATVLTDDVADRQVGLGDPRSDAAFRSIYFFPAGNTLAPIADDTYLNNEFWGGYASVDVDTEIGTITGIAGYRGASLDFRSNTPSFLINQREEDEQYSVELRFASRTDVPLQWLLGAYYFYEDIDVPDVSFNQQVSASYQQFFPTTESLAAFGRLTYNVTDRFRLNLGARYTVEDKDFVGNFYQLSVLCGGTVLRPDPTLPVTNCFGAPLLPNTIVPGPIFAPNGAVIPFQPFGFGSAFPGGPATTPQFLSIAAFSLDRSAAFDRFTWRAGFEYDVLDASLLYGSFETGFKSGGFFFTRDNPVYRPERIEAWTLGLKNRFLRNRLQLNLEAFWWEYRDQQVSSTSRDSQGAVIFATRNVGQSRNRGFEIEGIALVTPNTQLSANLQYLDAEYTSFIYLTPNQSPQVPGLNTSVPPVANCPFTLADPPTLYRQDCSGRRPPNAPEWVFSLGVEQTVPLGGWNLVLNARTRYQSKIFTGLEYLEVQEQEGYWQSDASITLAEASDRYFVTAFINNIENNDIIGNSFPHPFGGANLVVGSVRPPRTYGLRAGVRF
ncbi:TonB-dependent receptor [Sphingosinicella terrae]|uniref:TonB-dependent receptor n=1 Tax=Sphingosinicella terrae TaxID=2172047 RepID=UPI000E0DBD9E|nr:TonB-dependent receptor [Sphingosinicella terrae]